jgi:hypothetical protein
MKKIYVYNQDNNIIDNVEKVHISNLGSIPNGSCALIVCDCLDSLTYSDRLLLLSEVLKKAALNCSVILKMINLKLFCKHVFYDRLDLQQANNVLGLCNSMWDENSCHEILSQYNNFAIKENTHTGLIKQIVLERTS